ncbi:hypothetical protein [Mollivirus kamchatka]|nr:hypothetical protein [Mollivirus kamchatka]
MSLTTLLCESTGDCLVEALACIADYVSVSSTCRTLRLRYRKSCHRMGRLAMKWADWRVPCEATVDDIMRGLRLCSFGLKYARSLERWLEIDVERTIRERSSSWCRTIATSPLYWRSFDDDSRISPHRDIPVNSEELEDELSRLHPDDACGLLREIAVRADCGLLLATAQRLGDILVRGKTLLAESIVCALESSATLHALAKQADSSAIIGRISLSTCSSYHLRQPYPHPDHPYDAAISETLRVVPILRASSSNNTQGLSMEIWDERGSGLVAVPTKRKRHQTPDKALCRAEPPCKRRPIFCDDINPNTIR